MIKEFKDNKEFLSYYKSIPKVNHLGDGSVGTCYLGKDGLAYKYNNFCMYEKGCYNIDNIITNDQYNLDSFAFPMDIYTDENHDILYGYNSKAITNDFFFSEDGFLNPRIYNTNFDKLIECYYNMLKDVEVISKDNIFMYDLINNLLFNNQQLLAIDTINYEKRDDNTFDSNKVLLLDAILSAYDFVAPREIINNNPSIEKVVKYCKKKVKR